MKNPSSLGNPIIPVFKIEFPCLQSISAFFCEVEQPLPTLYKAAAKQLDRSKPFILFLG
jgi:hypothetical protein